MISSLVNNINSRIKSLLGAGLSATFGALTATTSALGAITGSTVAVTDRINTTHLGTAANPAIKCGTTGAGIYDSTVGLGLAYNGGVYVGISPGQIQILNGVLESYGGRRDAGILSPTALSGTVTDYNPFPSSIQTNTSVIRIDPGAAARIINSFVNAASGVRFTLYNISTTAGRNITLLHDDGATGTAIMRFLCPSLASVVIPPCGAVDIWYDVTTTRWRVEAKF